MEEFTFQPRSETELELLELAAAAGQQAAQGEVWEPKTEAYFKAQELIELKEQFPPLLQKTVNVPYVGAAPVWLLGLIGGGALLLVLRGR